MSKAEQDALRKLFEELPRAFPERKDSEDIRIINYSILLEIIHQLTDSSKYLQGYIDGQNHATKMAMEIIRGEQEPVTT